MNSIHSKLSTILRNLIDCIEGDWFVCDGALIGLIREGGMLSYDDDIDIYLLPDSKINIDKLKEKELSYQDYYMCGKVYDKNNEYIKKNTWLEFVNYNRHLPENYGMNRAELLKASKKHYFNNYIKAEFTYPCIDIFYLKCDVFNVDEYYLPFNYSKIYNTDYIMIEKKDTKDMKKMNLLGSDVYIPNQPEKMLEMIYGDWRTPKINNYQNHICKVV